MHSIADDAHQIIPQKPPDPESSAKATARRSGRSQRPRGAMLAEHHAEYLEARAVGASERGMFWTARKPSDIPDAFSDRQRRGGCALVAEFLSPDGQTVSWQARFDTPRRDRRGKLKKWVSPPGERTRIVLAVVPEMLDEVRNGTGPLWSVEGITRAAALAPYGIPAVAYPGCWNWQKDGEPLACWEHVNLAGRLVLVGMDGDWRINEKVQMALSEHKSYLESRGARVLVVDVPVGENGESGLDDALARGVSPHILALKAKPFEPVDVGGERLKRDAGLRVFIAMKLREAGELPATGQADCNARKVARFMVGVVPDHGKPDERGVIVHPSFPQIAEGTRLGSFQTVRKACERLETAGFFERLPRRSRKEATSYRLLYPSGTPWGGGSGQSVNIGGSKWGGGEGQERREQRSANTQNPLHERDSYLCLHSTRAPGDAHENLRKPKVAPEVPALRNSKLVHTRVPTREKPRGEVVHSDYYRRYGAKREEIARFVVGAGAVVREDLWERFGSPKSRLRDFMRTWIRPMLSDGVFVEDDALILPAPDWPEALERVRARTDEDADNRYQSEKYRERRRKYREHLSGERAGKVKMADPEPELAGKEHTRETLERNRPEWKRQDEQRERDMVAPAVAFVSETLEGLEHVRLALLEDMWSERGGQKHHLRLALRELRCKGKRHPEHPGELFIYPPADTGDVVSLPRREAVRPGTGREGSRPVATVMPLDSTRLENLSKPFTSSSSSSSSSDDELDIENDRSTTKKETDVNVGSRATLLSEDPGEAGFAETDPGGDWREHPLDCPCVRCGSPEPSYATPFVGEPA